MPDTVSIPPEELKRMIDRSEIEFILDLRYEDEFNDWRIEAGPQVETVNIEKIDFVGEEEKYFDRLPKNKQIVTICAHGDSSKYAAEFLNKHGFRALNLGGGMDAWSEYYDTRRVSDAPAVHQIYRVAKGCMTHVVVSDGEAVVIDPARHLAPVTSLLDDIGAKAVHIFDTHLQADHISGGRALADATGAAYHMHPIDADTDTLRYDRLHDGQTFTIGASVVQALHSPGHTPGSCSLLLDEKYLFTGDTVMKRSAGRPDLGGKAGEWSSMLYRTLFEKFASLPDDTVIFPSHSASLSEQSDGKGVSITFGEARKTLDLFQRKEPDAFAAYVRENLPEHPDRYREIREVNLGRLNPNETKRRELEIGKNLCGMK